MIIPFCFPLVVLLLMIKPLKIWRKMSGFAALLFVLVKTSVARTPSLILLSSLLRSSARVGLDAEKEM